MDSLFENSYTVDRELAKKIYGYFYYKSPVYIIYDIAAALVLLFRLVTIAYYQIVYDFYDRSALSLDLYILLLVVLMLGAQYWRYAHTVKSTLRRNAEVNAGQPLRVDSLVTDEYVRSTSSTGAVNTINFSSVKKVIRTGDLILLHTRANLLCVFPQDSFTRGTAEKLVSFLRQKGFKVR